MQVFDSLPNQHVVSGEPCPITAGKPNHRGHPWIINPHTDVHRQVKKVVEPSRDIFSPEVNVWKQCASYSFPGPTPICEFTSEPEVPTPTTRVCDDAVQEILVKVIRG